MDGIFCFPRYTEKFLVWIGITQSRYITTNLIMRKNTVKAYPFCIPSIDLQGTHDCELYHRVEYLFFESGK